MKVKSESEVTQSCPTLSDPMDCSLPGSSVHGIFQARVLEWGAMSNQYYELNHNERIMIISTQKPCIECPVLTRHHTKAVGIKR